MARYILVKLICLYIISGICACIITLNKNDSTHRQLEVYSTNLSQVTHHSLQRRGMMLKDLTKRQLTDAYYDFLINEGSFKFWAVFQMVTIAILFYSTFAAIYYAKYTYLHEQPSEDVNDLFIRTGRVQTKRDVYELLKAIHTPPR